MIRRRRKKFARLQIDGDVITIHDCWNQGKNCWYQKTTSTDQGLSWTLGPKIPIIQYGEYGETWIGHRP